MEYRLGEDRLTTAELARLARMTKPLVGMSENAIQRVQRYRAIVNENAQSDKAIYGINTGFGYLSDIRIDQDKLSTLQKNLIRSHACGVGPICREEIARAVMLLRAHTFLLGHSGISLESVKAIVDMVSHNVLPVIPEQGSVGASGDLAPLAHMALALMGEGEVLVEGKKEPAAQVFQRMGLKPVELGPKEGLSLINGTHFMSAIAAFAVEEAKTLARAADIAAALSLDACRGTTRAFDPRIHSVRPHQGQRRVAENILKMFAESDEIMTSHENCGKVQDPYSFRCTPQVHGASRDAVDYINSVLEIELNSVTDNPLVFDNGDLISGGNFHGQPVAMAMDFLAISIAEIGSISEQRIMKLTNPQMSGLPAFLMKESGINSGFMIPHVVAASLVSENKILTHPACVDSIPTSADKEDHVSMGPIAARKARLVNQNVAKVVAIELLAASQGLDLLRPLKPSPALQSVHRGIRKISSYMESDRALSRDIEEVAAWVLEDGPVKSLRDAGIEIY